MGSDIKWKFPENIVECEWLSKRLDDENVRIFDCTTYLLYRDKDPSKPYDVESGISKYKESHIPGSAFLDLQNDLSKKGSPYSFTLPDFLDLKNRFQNLGVGDPFHIILYSRNGTQWATRVWWMLFVLGFEKISVLDGGYDEWIRLSLPTEDSVRKFNPAKFNASFRENIFVGKESTLKAIGDKSCILLNALTKDIHSGENPRYGRPGRIPNSLNIPFHKLVDSNTGKFKKPEEAAEIFNSMDVSSDKTILNYCGGGIAATLDAFILYQLGFKNLQIYDNSMSEWAMDETLPIETDKL